LTFKPDFSNLWSENPTETAWKRGTAVVFTAGTAAALILVQTKWQPLGWFPSWPASLDIPHPAVLLVFCFSLAIFQFLHYWDGNNPEILGLRGRLKATKPDFGDYVSSAISRMSLQSSLGAGAVGAVANFAQKNCFTWLTLCILGIATIFGMVSVLCYAHASRWTGTVTKMPGAPDPKLSVRKDLLKKATLFDQFSWYTLTTGLIWSVALASPLLAIGANFVLGFLLWIYYFEFIFPPEDGSTPHTEGKDATTL
jgi:hypothetical protein